MSGGYGSCLNVGVNLTRSGIRYTSTSYNRPHKWISTSTVPKTRFIKFSFYLSWISCGKRSVPFLVRHRWCLMLFSLPQLYETSFYHQPTIMFGIYRLYIYYISINSTYPYSCRSIQIWSDSFSPIPKNPPKYHTQGAEITQKIAHRSTFIIIYHQLSSIIIIYHQLSSIIIIYHHLSSFIINYHHLSSFIINYHHLSSFIINYHHLSSIIIIYHHLSSFIIIYHQLSSFIIIYHQLSSFIIIYHQLSWFIHISWPFPSPPPSAPSGRTSPPCLPRPPASRRAWAPRSPGRARRGAPAGAPPGGESPVPDSMDWFTLW